MKKKRLLAKIIMRCPGNNLRIFLYKLLLSYKIGKDVQIGRSILLCESLHLGDKVTIKDRNVIKCKDFYAGDGTKINSGNRIAGTASFSIGKNSRILNDHFIDVSREVKIGNSTWIAGKGSQFWTHGSIYTKGRSKSLGIEIKDHVYIGSNVMISPGVRIESINLVGLGSVVSHIVDSQKNIIAGNPARVVKENIDWRENW